eukprot:Unigene15604_Nuclearia_a/m.46561 Unigene15604_Nuclearia_a/g.46561  ORF Unigene15604_Nuclearia_a/g.46561 Unigene15604_Nuclearia_a/m.46561 type:complete len:432 (-) Unigene15604_Nuclearia_a:599-1894(-)
MRDKPGRLNVAQQPQQRPRAALRHRDVLIAGLVSALALRRHHRHAQSQAHERQQRFALSRIEWQHGLVRAHERPCAHGDGDEVDLERRVLVAVGGLRERDVGQGDRELVDEVRADRVAKVDQADDRQLVVAHEHVVVVSVPKDDLRAQGTAARLVAHNRRLVAAQMLGHERRVQQTRSALEGLRHMPRADRKVPVVARARVRHVEVGKRHVHFGQNPPERCDQRGARPHHVRVQLARHILQQAQVLVRGCVVDDRLARRRRDRARHGERGRAQWLQVLHHRVLKQQVVVGHARRGDLEHEPRARSRRQQEVLVLVRRQPLAARRVHAKDGVRECARAVAWHVRGEVDRALERLVQRPHKVVDVGSGDAHRRLDLEHIVVRAVGAHEHAVGAHVLADEACLHRCRRDVVAVKNQLDADEEAYAAHVADEGVA